MKNMIFRFFIISAFWWLRVFVIIISLEFEKFSDMDKGIINLIPAAVEAVKQYL